MIGYVVRDNYDDPEFPCTFYEKKPERVDESGGHWTYGHDENGQMTSCSTMLLPEDWFKEITWESEPVIAELQITTFDFNLVKRMLLNMIAPKMWGIMPEKGWVRPQVIAYNGEWYIRLQDDTEYFQDPYYNYKQDVENGIYVPTGVKVGEENK